MTDLHDFTDGEFWRSLSPSDVLNIVRTQVAESYEGAPVIAKTPRQVIRDALAVVTEDTFDRAVDMSSCNKADGCRGAAAFLAWLSWRIDDGLMAEFDAAGAR